MNEQITNSGSTSGFGATKFFVTEHKFQDTNSLHPQRRKGAVKANRYILFFLVICADIMDYAYLSVIYDFMYN